MTKPRMRGIPDVFALIAIVPATVLLLINVPQHSLWVATIYSIALFFLFGISASYHAPNWTQKRKKVWQRMDHSMIYVFIAASYTPAAWCSLPEASAITILSIVWGIAFFGIFKTLFWPGAPRWVSVAIYIGMGWSIVPYLGAMKTAVGTTSVVFFFVGGILYSIGGLIYGLKYPNHHPKTWGYHENMHLFIIAGAAVQFVGEWRVMMLG